MILARSRATITNFEKVIDIVVGGGGGSGGYVNFARKKRLVWCGGAYVGVTYCILRPGSRGRQEGPGGPAAASRRGARLGRHWAGQSPLRRRAKHSPPLLQCLSHPRSTLHRTQLSYWMNLVCHVFQLLLLHCVSFIILRIVTIFVYDLWIVTVRLFGFARIWLVMLTTSIHKRFSSLIIQGFILLYLFNFYS